MTQKEKLKIGIRKMFKARDLLHEAFPKRPFTPDGRMIGDIGEALAKIYYGVQIDEKSRKHWDGKYKGEDVQIKATQKDETYLKKPPHDGYLFVFQILPDGNWRTCYKGKIMKIWNRMNGMGIERFIKLKKLK